MLRVKGDSMIEEGIYDGDYVVCQPSNTANDGDIVVALIDNQEATLKRLYISNVDNKILLCPANSSMTPLEYDADRVQIQGILRCQLRKY
jgi:repressor LexA